MVPLFWLCGTFYFSFTHSSYLGSELIAVGKSEAALKTLHDVLMQRKNRTWSDVYEPFALKYAVQL
jgi:hypothetical protein